MLNNGFTQNPLLDIIHQNKATFGDIFDRPDHYEVQIIYTQIDRDSNCLLYTSPSPRDRTRSRMPSSA